MTAMDRQTLLERLRGIEWDDFEVKEAAHGPLFPLLREALINLLVHQDHCDHRIARVQLFRDRGIFDNPGDSLVPTDELLQGGVTVSRNPLIQQTIRLCELAEQAGMGMVKLHERWQTLTGHRPIVTNDPAQKTYAIEFAWGQDFVVEPVAPPVAPPVTPPVTPPVEALPTLLSREGPLGAKAIREGLGLKDRAHVREEKTVAGCRSLAHRRPSPRARGEDA